MEGYSPISTPPELKADDTIYIITTSLPDICSGHCLLLELLNVMIESENTGFALIDFATKSGSRSKPYALRTFPISKDTSLVPVSDAISGIFNSVASDSVTISTVCCAPHGKGLADQCSESFLVILRHFEEGTDCLVNLTYSEKTALVDRLHYIGSQKPIKRDVQKPLASRRPFQICSALLLLTLVLASIFIFYPHNQTSREGFSGAQKKPDQFFVSRLSASNISTWLSQNSNAQDFTYRSDDQFLVPTSLYMPADLRINAWFESTYPALRNISASRRYLEPSFLAGDHEPLIVDHRFHVAHCIAALRRSFLGLQNGGEICRQGELERHTEHCFGLLEDWILVNEGEHPENRKVMINYWLDVCEPVRKIVMP